MAKRIEIDGKFYRKRKGKLAQIPDAWVGKVVCNNTKTKREQNALEKKEKRKVRIRKLREELEEEIED